MRNFDKELFSKLDYGFIELNRKAYLLRYTDDLPQNFNLVIASREFLAELDHTVLALQQRFSISQDGEPCRTKFQALLSARDSRIFSENHVLARTPKEDFIYQSPQYVYEVRNDGSRGLVEVNYMTTSKAIVAGFLRPGFTPKDNEHKSYELSHLPLSSSRG